MPNSRQGSHSLEAGEGLGGFGALAPCGCWLIVGALKRLVRRAGVGGDQCGGIDEKFIVDVLKGRGCFKGISHHTWKNNDVLTDLDFVIQGIQEGFEVLGVLVGVNGHDDLEEHHLTCAEQAEGSLATLAGIALFGGDDGQVVEACFQWKVHASDVTMLELKDGRELTADGFTQEAVLHRWKTDNGGGKNGVLSAGDGRYVEDGVLAR